jgi:hypothetical protein
MHLTFQGDLDKMCWSLSMNQKVMQNSFIGLYEVFNRAIWKTKLPRKVGFFFWTATHGKILMMDNLQKHKITIVDWCCMCKADGETFNHLQGPSKFGCVECYPFMFDVAYLEGE